MTVKTSPINAIRWLVFASIVFYGYWNFAFLFLLLASITVNFLFGQTLSRPARPQRLAVLTVAVITNLALLFYFKYISFILFDVFGLSRAAATPFEAVLPLGISIYTFTQIAYLVDCYRGDADQRQSGFFHYALFVLYFPHLISGPIVHHKQMISQFLASRRPSRGQLLAGTALFMIGLAKKALLADSLAPMAGDVFRLAETGPVVFWQAWFGVLAYSFQIYFDFSGYSDMAAGLSLLLGYRLPANFNSPYQASSIIEFWRRWHMSLSSFLRDYLYIPLGGNRHGPWRRHSNIFVTMLLGGLWHGAGFGFIIWGAIHGAALVLNHALREVRPQWRMPRPVAVAATFLVVVMAWVPFRAVAIEPTLSLWASLLGLNGLDLPVFNGPYLVTAADRGLSAPMDPLSALIILLAAAAIAFLLPNSLRMLARFRPVLDDLGAVAPGSLLRWRPSRRWIIATGCLGGAALAVTVSSASREFLYFQF